MSRRKGKKNPDDRTKDERLAAMQRKLAYWEKVEHHLAQMQRAGADRGRVEIYGHPNRPTIVPMGVQE